MQYAKVLKPILEALAGVPTIVYAYFALTFVTQDVLRPLLGNQEVPIFNAFSASLMLAVMILPTIASISEDAMASVPRDLREAAYGLGATKLEVAIRVVFRRRFPASLLHPARHRPRRGRDNDSCRSGRLTPNLLDLLPRSRR
jgi:ABC-type phosphate transport system permease subunit